MVFECNGLLFNILLCHFQVTHSILFLQIYVHYKDMNDLFTDNVEISIAAGSTHYTLTSMIMLFLVMHNKDLR